MDKEEKAFFEIIRLGLWGNAPQLSNIMPNLDWEKIYRMGKKQSVVALMLDGIELLPKECRPPRQLYIQWCLDTITIEDMNRTMNIEIVNLFKMLRNNDIEPILFKGQSVAQYYRNPLHRSCGDIDIYTRSENYGESNRLLKIEGTATIEETIKHSAFRWHDIPVENHLIITKLMNPFNDRKLQKIIKSWAWKGGERNMDIEGYKVKIPPLEFDAFFILQHAITHLLELGIGLRQIIDWTMLLHYNNANINREEAVKILKKTGMDRPARVFGAIAVNYLGLPPEDLLLPYDKKDERYAARVIDDVMRGGNFGSSFNYNNQLPKNYWLKKLHTFKTSVKRSWLLRKVAPKEAYWVSYTMLESHISLRLRPKRPASLKN